MTNQARIAAEQMRRRIPTEHLMNFEELTNTELAWLSQDEWTRQEVRAFAGWELEYREAFDVDVFIDDDGTLKRART